ncbi:MAG TPA: DUF4190 domain-containing protein [Jatrophihabitans sp.]|jgi:hypothetical protein|uniref:DUF4190 domain-containing protein n=1 Tax=Jatrophihabitans sp. TaxID=1932789 RepID=UPI002E04D3F4|nr:DUF4190 domain-containing protein [Jatrophihabitans sp.]
MSYPDSGDQPQYPNPPQGQGDYGYGQPGGYAPPPYGGYPQPKQGNGMAIAGLVCGIIGLIVFGIILGPLALIFGGIGLNRANKGASGKGMAIAGVVLGAIDTVLAIIFIAVVANRGFVY